MPDRAATIERFVRTWDACSPICHRMLLREMPPGLRFESFLTIRGNLEALTDEQLQQVSEVLDLAERCV